MHIPKKQRPKFDSKITPCVFVGYKDEEFDYTLWDPKKRKIVRSRHDVFHKYKTTVDSDRYRKNTQYRTIAANMTPLSISFEDATYG